MYLSMESKPNNYLKAKLNKAYGTSEEWMNSDVTKLFGIPVAVLEKPTYLHTLVGVDMEYNLIQVMDYKMGGPLVACIANNEEEAHTIRGVVSKNMDKAFSYSVFGYPSSLAMDLRHLHPITSYYLKGMVVFESAVLPSWQLENIVVYGRVETTWDIPDDVGQRVVKEMQDRYYSYPGFPDIRWKAGKLVVIGCGYLQNLDVNKVFKNGVVGKYKDVEDTYENMENLPFSLPVEVETVSAGDKVLAYYTTSQGDVRELGEYSEDLVEKFKRGDMSSRSFVSIVMSYPYTNDGHTSSTRYIPSWC